MSSDVGFPRFLAPKVGIVFDFVRGHGVFVPSSRAMEWSSWVEFLHHVARVRDSCSPRLSAADSTCSYRDSEHFLELTLLILFSASDKFSESLHCCF